MLCIATLPSKLLRAPRPKAGFILDKVDTPIATSETAAVVAGAGQRARTWMNCRRFTW